MWSPPQPPFLGAEAGPATSAADVLIAGVPIDGAVSFRGGASEGPHGIRVFSDSIETWSQRARRDLEDLHIVDCGDGDDFDGLLDDAWASGRRPLLCTFGGDHSVTPPIVRSVSARTPGLVMLAFDAHLDLRHHYHGEHACATRRVVDAGIDVVSLGVRSGERPEWDDAERVLAHWSHDVAVTDDARRHLEGRAVYITVDIDVLDPSAAPGTGTPEAGGAGFSQLLSAIESVVDLDVVAFDIVEVAPPLDPSGITQAAAALLAREMMLRFSR